MILVVGLGNPGKKYENTRHNVGFMAVDALADDLGASFTKSEKFNSDIAEVTVQLKTKRVRLVLAKPQTYMNNSGEAVSKILNFYKLRPQDQLWVIHDDLDIDLGTLRIRLKGSSAGQKGVQSIIDQLGTDEFVRFRVGICPVDGKKGSTESFVLKKFNKAERLEVDRELETLTDTIKAATDRGIVNTTL